MSLLKFTLRLLFVPLWIIIFILFLLMALLSEEGETGGDWKELLKDLMSWVSTGIF